MTGRQYGNATGWLHHVEVWVPSLRRAEQSWGWLLGELGWAPYQRWPAGRSWRLGHTYVVLEESPALTATTHDRLRPGLNHLAFHAGTTSPGGPDGGDGSRSCLVVAVP